MKSVTKWKPYINYRGKKWYPIDRVFDNFATAERCVDHIADNHVGTTRIALVAITTTYNTLSVAYGKKKSDQKVSRYEFCSECKKRRYRKNIDPNTGLCLACAMRLSIEHEQGKLEV